MLSIEQLALENHLVRKLDAATDERGLVLGTIFTPRNVHDSYVLQPLVKKLLHHVKKH